MSDVYRMDCFAAFEAPNGRICCNALINPDCENCKFYRNDIKRKDIERDIDYYTKGKVSRKNEY